MIGTILGTVSGFYVSRPSTSEAAYSDGYGSFDILDFTAYENRNISEVRFDPNDNDVFYYAASAGQHKIYKYTISTATHEEVYKDEYNGYIVQFDISSDSKFLYLTADSGVVKKVNIDPSDPGYKTETLLLDKYEDDTAEVDVNSPMGIALSETRNKLYIGDYSVSHGPQIYSYDLTSGAVELVAGSDGAYDSCSGGEGPEVCDGIGTEAQLNLPFYFKLLDENTLVFFDQYDGYSLRTLNLDTNEVKTPFVDPMKRRITGFSFINGTHEFFATSVSDFGDVPAPIYRMSFDDYSILETIDVPTVAGFQNSYCSGVDISPDGKTLLVSNGDNKGNGVLVFLVNIDQSSGEEEGGEEKNPEDSKDTSPPIISKVTVSNKKPLSSFDSSATITWLTNEKSTSKVHITHSCFWSGGDGWYEAFDNSLVLEHKIEIRSLAHDKTCTFYVESKDAWGNIAKSPNYSFKTYSATEEESKEHEEVETEEESKNESSEEQNNQTAESQEINQELSNYDVTNDQSLVSRAKKTAVIIQGVFTDIIEETPEPVAKSFPYLLFALLALSAFIFMTQTKKEAEKASEKLEMIKIRKTIASEKEIFISVISHYLRTPLTLILNGIEESDFNDSTKKKMRKFARKLQSSIKSLLSRVERDKKTLGLKDPSLKLEGARLFFSPFITLPILSVGGLAVWANYLFVNLAEINIGTINVITQALVFIVAAQLFFFLARQRLLQKHNLKYFDETIKYQVAVDEARSKVIVDISGHIKEAVDNFKKIAKNYSNEYISEGLRRLEELIAKVGYFSGIQYEDIKSEKKPYKIEGVVNEIIKGYKKQINSKGLEIVVDTDNVKISKRKKVVKMILEEIIDNAIKYSPKSGKIEISAYLKNDIPRVSITDEGPGISKKKQLSLFKPFSRVGSTLRFDYEGLGLGMYYARSLTNMIGGDIIFDSEENKGTKVLVVL